MVNIAFKDSFSHPDYVNSDHLPQAEMFLFFMWIHAYVVLQFTSHFPGYVQAFHDGLRKTLFLTRILKKYIGLNCNEIQTRE